MQDPWTVTVGNPSEFVSLEGLLDCLMLLLDQSQRPNRDAQKVLFLFHAEIHCIAANVYRRTVGLTDPCPCQPKISQLLYI